MGGTISNSFGQSRLCPDPQNNNGGISVGPEAYGRRCSAGVEAGVSAVHGRAEKADGNAYVDSSLLSGSAAVSEHKAEAAAYLARVSGGIRAGSFEGKASAESLSAYASVGEHNPDGSHGIHSRMGANLASWEVTGNYSGNSATVGWSNGLSAGFSAGTRDSDNDGKSEACVRLEALFATVGLCVENPF